MPKAVNLCISFFVLLAFSMPGYALFGPKCKHADKSKKPQWVHDGFSHAKPGFMYGFGVALYDKEQSYEDQLAKAENLARADLVKGLQVEVNEELDVRTTQATRNKDVDYNQDITRRIRTRTRLELPGLDIEAKWQDKKSCDLYVLVEISNHIANLISQKAIVKSYHAQAKDESLDLQTRLAMIDNAIELAQKWDFGKLSNSRSSKHMIKEFSILRDELKKNLRNRRNAVHFILPPQSGDVAAIIMQQLTAKVKGSFKGQACSSPTLCLSKAQDTPAQYATIVNGDLSVGREHNFYIGLFDLQITVIDLSNNTPVYTFTDQVELKTARVMSRQKHGITTEKAYDKWLRTNPDAWSAFSFK